ncbi:MAG TPA: aminotransferase class V-fold PLP-dependent enzyme, partial [Thermoanaerobaculia bacterium]|nr:aminotransferase class V-fold PLP-dependent enzyme [Thermoanaerobaculia bacterium]
GWWNIRHERSYLDYRLDFHLSARRYEPGTLPTANIAGLSASMDLLSEIGPSTIRDRILETNAVLKRGLIAHGWRIVSPEPVASGILAAVPSAADSGATAKRLEARGIIVAPREGAVRFSPHAYNDLAEVARILEALEETG